MFSYFKLRHSRSMYTLPIQRPRPSVEIRITVAAERAGEEIACPV
jgi:hypothetical protein